jgi:ABC-type multidrug transport system fused ATPase/permease subunit
MQFDKCPKGTKDRPTQLRIVTYCEDNVLGRTEKPGMTRDALARVVVAFDIFVCLFFVAFVEYGLKLIDYEEKLNKSTSVLITDFAVRIGGLPAREVFGTHTALEAKLVHHINNMVKHKDQAAKYTAALTEQKKNNVKEVDCS